MKIRVAGFQMPVTKDIKSNAQKIITAVDWTADNGGEILLTPEGSLSGYTHVFDAKVAEAALVEVTAYAASKGVGLALGTCFMESSGSCYDQIRFYRPDGEYLGFHSKTLLCGSLREPFSGEINHYSVSPLRVFEWRKGLPIGGLVCNDLWASPEFTPMPDSHMVQQLANMGARIVFHSVSGMRGVSEWRRLAWTYKEANLRMRARAAGVWIVTVDNAHPVNQTCSSPGGVIDPTGRFVLRTETIGSRCFVYTIDPDNYESVPNEG